MKVLGCSVLFFVEFSILLNSQQWKLQNSGTTTGCNDVYFINTSFGYVVGYSDTILVTSNGGVLWKKRLIASGENFKSVFFIDSLTGWVLGSKGLIYNTTDGGENWIKQYNCSIPLHDIQFIDRAVGWAVGGIERNKGVSGKILKTSDGGVSWSEVIDSTKGGYLSLSFLNKDIGWVVGGKHLFDNSDEDIILHTTDAGIHWTEQFTPTKGPLRKVFFINEDSGWACGSPPTLDGILRTTDGGKHWYTIQIQQPIISTELYSGLTVIDSNIWISAVNKIYHSSNNGNTWHTETRESNNLIGSIFFTDIKNGWAAGDNGSIWKYSTELSSVTELELHSRRLNPDIYPIPSSSIFSIKYILNDNTNIVAKFLNMLGEEVSTLIDAYQYSGSYEISFDCSKYISGIYFVQFSAEKYSEIQKILIINKY